MANRIYELERLITYHKALYYQGRTEISDHEYDNLETELKKLDPNNHALTLVGSAQSGNDKVAHHRKMLSLDKTYDFDELKKWMGSEEVYSTLKIDGTSCSLIYERGKLSLAKTRGDGKFGENITAKVTWIESIPKMINSKSDFLEIRGEIFARESDFFKLAEEMVAIEKERPSSQRNIVAGLISRKENLELCRYLSFMPFDLEGEVSVKTEVEKNGLLKSYGFNPIDGMLHKNLTTLEDAVDEAKHFMAEGEFQIDGLVFSYNQISLHDELGETNHHPRYKMAFKFKGESKNTKIKEIVWSVSRNGILTPVANVEKIELSGAMISKVTLHNYGLVKQYNLKRDDEIEIIRSGEVIPKFLSVVKESKNIFTVPEFCPVCESKTEVRDIRLLCSNEKCPGKVKEEILNFIQKIGIDDLSSKRLDEMLRLGLVRDITDLYKITPEDFLKLDNFQDKLANKLYDSIQVSKSVDIKIFVSALGIKGGAYNKCSKVVDAGFDTIKKLKDLTLVDLLSVDSFADKSATDFLSSFKSKHGLINKLVSVGFTFSAKKKNSKISGKKICITGSLSEKRSVIEQMIRDAGGVVVSSVSKNTDILLTNDSSSGSSKAQKALELGVEIVCEEKLIKLLNQ